MHRAVVHGINVAKEGGARGVVTQEVMISRKKKAHPKVLVARPSKLAEKHCHIKFPYLEGVLRRFGNSAWRHVYPNEAPHYDRGRDPRPHHKPRDPENDAHGAVPVHRGREPVLRQEGCVLDTGSDHPGQSSRPAVDVCVSPVVNQLADSAGCMRDLPFIQQLGINAIQRQLDAQPRHVHCGAQRCGHIHHFGSLSLNGSIDTTQPTWRTNLQDENIKTIDAFSKYDNVLAYNVSNEVLATNTVLFIKAAPRDMKACLSAMSIDLFGPNNYEWGGNASTTTYHVLNAEFAKHNVAAYLAEFLLMSGERGAYFRDERGAGSVFPVRVSRGSLGLGWVRLGWVARKWDAVGCECSSVVGEFGRAVNSGGSGVRWPGECEGVVQRSAEVHSSAGRQSHGAGLLAIAVVARKEGAQVERKKKTRMQGKAASSARSLSRRCRGRDEVWDRGGVSVVNTPHALSSMVPHLLTVIVQARNVKLGLPHVNSSYYPTFLKSLHAGLRGVVQICAANSLELAKVHWLEDIFPRGKGFEIPPVDNSLVLPSDYVLSKPSASVVPPSTPTARLAPSSSTSRPPAKKDKKKAKEDKRRDSEHKPCSSDGNSDGLDLVTPAANMPREASKGGMMLLSEFPAESAVCCQKATGARPQSLLTPKMMMTTKLNTGDQFRKRPADDNVPAEAHTKKKSRQVAPKTPAIIEDVSFLV
ncbi:hypothetical protein K438DRAFT_1753487 [Mycena galopus ATCC 62051]|nr:hypothetical protein K438DRAFT_1753487 [Mycena galopus ATCC 62051]